MGIIILTDGNTLAGFDTAIFALIAVWMPAAPFVKRRHLIRAGVCAALTRAVGTAMSSSVSIYT